ncbi:glycoside hydrolase family 31 protein [Clostridium sp. MCC353]|uniref:glycoside hydrolase family 31 protein n=1 Tax=Clostridium sp. MCC353 TaxID=2592646 RepID=UPI001C0321AD|nr:TIM-barrel domain-containing protein [Clostridium sp. MCC353]MBT9775667.1 glycoside hydrolase family 31 protein [Clostridium sp. MCC353]
MAYYKIPEFTGETDGKKIIWEDEGEILWMEPYGSDVIRVRASRSLRIDGSKNWTLLPPENAKNAFVVKDKSEGRLYNGKITGSITGDGTIAFYNQKGTILLEESWIDGRVNTAPLRRAREYNVLAGDVFETDVYFKPRENEHFYGLGQEPNGCFDLKGASVELVQKNTKCTIPFLFSSLGYGIIWNNPAVGRAELGTNHTRWHANACGQIDYLVIAGDTPEDILKAYARITGYAPVLPRWAMGLWQSKLRYENQEEVLEVVREYARRKIPLSVIIIDYFHWTQQGEWKFDPECWPDPEGMVKEAEKLGTKIMVSVWPTVDPRSENYTEMKKNNYLIKAEKGVNVQFMFYGPETYYDATHEGARKYIWSKMKENYFKLGIKNYWLDEAEPEYRPYDFDNVRYYAGNGMEVSSIYPFYHAKAFYDGAKEAGADEVVNLVRCGWLGSQRLGAVIWSGDVESSFDSLQKQMKAGLHMAMCGIPWWTTDIGGFVNGDPEDEKFRELLIRWFQYGIFCPILRLHGYRLPYIGRELENPNGRCFSGGPNEIWSFGDYAYGILKNCIMLREKLIPYLDQQMKLASGTGVPVMRPMFFDFYTDEKTYLIGDQFMFGPDILVAPVIEAGKTQRTVYLPEGCIWTDAGSGMKYTGGREITVSAGIDTIPYFYKNDFIL